MASADRVDSVHRHITWFTGIGATGALLGMATFLGAYEHRDFDRVDVQSQEGMDKLWKRRRQVAYALTIIGILLYLGGLTVLTLGVCLYPDEREHQGATIASLIQQVRNTNAQPTVNEPAILSGISSALIATGAILGARHFHHTETWGWAGSTCYAAGWIGQAFAAAANNKALSSLKTSRLAWTLPGAAALVGGTFMLPWQLSERYIAGPGWPCIALGYAAWSIGTSYVTPAPEIV